MPSLDERGTSIDATLFHHTSFHNHVNLYFLVSDLLFAAEKALAILQGRPMPGMTPPVIIRLSPYPPTEGTVLPSPTAAPRLVKQLPSDYTDSQLYDLFRPFGPLASVRVQAGFGIDTGIVEFWREEDAKAAEENLHCAEVEDRNIAVQVYHPPRRLSSTGTEFNAAATVFVPSNPMFASPQQVRSNLPWISFIGRDSYEIGSLMQRTPIALRDVRLGHLFTGLVNKFSSHL